MVEAYGEVSTEKGATQCRNKKTDCLVDQDRYEDNATSKVTNKEIRKRGADGVLCYLLTRSFTRLLSCDTNIKLVFNMMICAPLVKLYTTRFKTIH